MIILQICTTNIKIYKITHCAKKSNIFARKMNEKTILLLFLVAASINGESLIIFEEGELVLSLLRTNHYDSVSMVTFYSCRSADKGNYCNLTRFKHILTNKFTDITSMIKRLSLYGISTLILKDFDGFYIEYKAVEHALIIVDVSCIFTDFLIEKANEYQMFGVPYKWLLLHDTNLTSFDVEETFKHAEIFVDSDVTFAQKVGNEENVFEYNLMKIYKRKLHLNLIYEEFGLFTKGFFIANAKFQRITATRRQNLGNITLNNCNVVTHNETYRHLLDKRFKHIDTITKVNYVFMLHLADMLNVTMNFSFVGTWGYLSNNSQWTGMIGELTRKHADIGGINNYKCL